MMEILTKTLTEALFAGIVAVGFALISDPPKRLLIATAFLAAVGRGTRYFLTENYDLGLTVSTFSAAAVIGFLGMYLANKLRCSMEVVSFPALLPMIPGYYAYRAILSVVLYGQIDEKDITAKQNLIVTIFDNTVTTLSIVTALAVGVTIPLLIFYEKSFTMTRKKREK